MDTQLALVGADTPIRRDRPKPPPAPPAHSQPVQLALLATDEREFPGQPGMLDIAGQLVDDLASVAPVQPFRPARRRRPARPGAGGPIAVTLPIDVPAPPQPVPCHDCGRELTDPDSVGRGRGPICAAKARAAAASGQDGADDGPAGGDEYRNGSPTRVEAMTPDGALL